MNKNFYTYVFFLLFAFIFFLFILFIIASIIIKKRKYNTSLLIKILKYGLPLLNTFSSQIFYFLCLAIDYDSNALHDFAFPIISSSFCQLQIILSVISILLLIFLCFITEAFYYKANFINDGKDIISKHSTTSGRVFLISKLIIVISFVIENRDEKYHWLFLSELIFISSLNVYFSNFYYTYKNKSLNKLHKLLSIIILWGYISLLIGKIFLTWKFNCAVLVFIFGIFLIIFIHFYQSDKNVDFTKIDFELIISSKERIDYIKNFLNLVHNKDKSRDISIILRTLIEKREANCVNNNCNLKKYLNSSNNNINSDFFLFLFAENLFKSSMNKFPNDIELKLNYIIFLLTDVNKKKRAKKELSSIKTNILSLENSFKIFRLGKFIDEYNSNTQSTNEVINKEILLALEYKKFSTEFKNLLLKVSNLYYEFWYSVFASHTQGTEDFKKLNVIGAEINELLEEVDKEFENLFKIKNNDSEILKIYTTFLKDILNDNEKYEKYHNIMVNLCVEKVKDIKNVDYSNFDMKILNETDEYQYLIVSANSENLGTIINMSLNLSVLFCYHKNELINKHINFLLPEIFHECHDKILHEYTENIKFKFYENFAHKMRYYPEYLEKFVYFKNKLKYLIPIFFKVYFVLTEENENVYIIEVNRQEQGKNNYLLCSEDIEYSCCILTDLNLLIQSFTPKSMEALGLNSKLINSNYEITQFIKEFNDDFFDAAFSEDNEFFEFDGSEVLSEIKRRNSLLNSKKMNTIKNRREHYLSNIPIEKKLKLKRKIIKEKYSYNRKITWNISSSSKINKVVSDISLSSIINNIINIDKKNNINNNFVEKECFMKVNEVIIHNKLIGYKFLFKPIINKQNQIQKEKNKSQRFSENKTIDTEALITSGTGITITQPRFSADSNKNKPNSFCLKESRKRSNKKNNIYDDFKEVFYVSNYIPKSNFCFYLDTNKLSYLPSNIIINPDKQIFLNNLRIQALNKMKNYKNANNKTKKELTDSSNYNSEEDSSRNSEFESNEEEGESSSILSSRSDISANSSNLSDKKNENKKQNSSFSSQKNPECEKIEFNDYYKVNISKIRFMIFDYDKEMIVDSSIDKMSQMDKIINNSRKHSVLYLNEDASYLTSLIPRKSRKNLNMLSLFNDKKNDPNANDDNKKNNIKNEIQNSALNTFNQKINKKLEFEKEISDSLVRNNTLNEVLFLSIISVFVFILIFAMSFYEVFFIKLTSSKMKKLYNLFVDATDLRYWTSYSIYYIRELTLLNMENPNVTNGTYINIPAKNRTLYSIYLLNSAKNAFNKGHLCIENIVGSNLKFSQETNNELNVKTYSTKSLLKNYKLQNINTTLTISLLQLYASLFNLISYKNNIQQNNDDLFNFLYNALNSMNTGLKTQLNVILTEFFKNCRRNIKLTILTLLIFLLLYVICYIIMVIRFSYIAKRKISYINVFFGIKLNLIITSISKCEKFMSELNRDDDYIPVNEECSESEDDIDLLSSKEINKSYIENSEIKSNKKTKHIKIKGDSKIKFFRIIYLIILLFSFLYLLIIFILFLKLITDIIIFGKYDLYLQKLNNNFLELFNTYREFLFDNESIISNENCLTHLKNLENEIYSQITEDYIFLEKYYKKLGSDLIKYYDNFNGTCTLKDSYYFNNQTECIEYYGSIEHAGDPTLFIYFVDGIRIAKNLVTIFLDQNLIVGNLTKYNGTFTNENLGLNSNKSFIFRLELFNMKNTHKELNLYFSDKIFPYIDKERNITITSIHNKNSGLINLFNILAIVHIVIIFLIFIFIWIPILGKINTSLNKTKNILTIIPIKILALQPGIKNLLNIKVKSSN